MKPILPTFKESDARRTPGIPTDTHALAEVLRSSISGEVRFDSPSLIKCRPKSAWLS